MGSWSIDSYYLFGYFPFSGDCGAGSFDCENDSKLKIFYFLKRHMKKTFLVTFEIDDDKAEKAASWAWLNSINLRELVDEGYFPVNGERIAVTAVDEP